VTSSALTYRPEIDGLRALAVLSVVLFHLDFGVVPGGFIGVDVFFVISGFLITSIILQEQTAGHFSFAGFYERRIRRILPAAFVVIAATLLAGVFILLPTHYETLSFTAVMSLLYVSNLYFWKTEDYFQIQPQEQPLLHTWSLSVEEQFYILFPIFIILALRFFGRDGAFWLLLVCALGSLALAEFAVQRNSLSFAFYQLPARAWELAVGSLLAFHKIPATFSVRLANILSVFGMGFILGGALLLSKTVPFPGLYALGPVIGAGLIIYAGQQANIIGPLLSNRCSVFVGKISYSLYLWHWQLIAFAYYRFGEDLGVDVKIAILIASFILSFLSFKYVEQPFRNRNFLRRAQVFIVAVLGSLILILSAALINQSKGFESRLTPQVKLLAQGEFDINPRRAACHSYRDFSADFAPQCLLGGIADGPVRAVLWGDSHADAVAPGIDEFMKQQGIKGVQITKNSCPPLPGIYLPSKFISQQECMKFNEDVLAYIERNPQIEYVIVSSRWITSATGAMRADDHQSGGEVLESGLLDLKDRLAAAGKTMLVIGQAPAFTFHVPQCLAKQAWFDDPGRFACTPPGKADFEKSFAPVQEIFDRLEGSGVKIFRPARVLCPANAPACLMLDDDGRPLYFDNNHLSGTGARYLAPAMQFEFSL
jgi:peptidoglycan/LPS O-acetylase OafA/YrhL